MTLSAGVRLLLIRGTSVLCVIACFITSANRHCDAETVEDRTFITKCDGSEQQYVLVVPAEFQRDGSGTVLIALHGHGSDRWQFVRQDRGECRAARDVAAAHGALLVSPDYRAKTSWMGPQAEADVVQIIGSIKNQFRVKHVILSGGSMGGAGALTLAALHAKLIDGVVSLNGTANLVEYERFLDALAASYGGTKLQVPDEYRKRSAEFFPERFTMPLAVTTGGADQVVPPDSVLRLIKALRGRNQHVLSLHRPNGGHSTSYDDSRKAFEFVFDALRERS